MDSGKARQGRFLPAIVEPHAVDDRFVFHQAKKARAGVAGLGKRSQRADLGKAKAQGEHLGRHFPIFVITSRETNRIWKIKARHPRRQHRIIWRCAPKRQPFQRGKAEAMGGFALQGKDQRAEEGIKGHAIRLSAIESGRELPVHGPIQIGRR